MRNRRDVFVESALAVPLALAQSHLVLSSKQPRVWSVDGIYVIVRNVYALSSKTTL